MRKLIALFLTLMLLLSVWPAAALPTEDLTDLARYVPADAPVFVAVRSDDAYLETLDDLLDQLGTSFTPLRAIDIDTLLDLAVASLGQGEDGDFDTLVRPWLGDTIALAIVDNSIIASNADPEALRLLASISDQDAAESFFDRLGGFAFEKTESDSAILYSSSDASFVIYDDAIVIAPAPLAEPEGLLSEATASLAATDVFQTTLALLPEDDYNLAAYLDVATLLAPLVPSIQPELDDANLNIDAGAALAALGPQALGATILDDRSLTLDIYANVADPDALTAAGIPLDPTIDPISLDFLSNVPADTPLFLQDRGLGQALLDGLNQAEMLGEMFDEQFEQGLLSFNQQALTQVDDVVTFIRLSFQGMAGLSLEDAFGWMTGDYVVYADADFQTEQRILPILGIVASGEGDASATLDGFENLFTELDLFAERDGDTITIPAVADIFEDDSLDIILSAGDGSLSLGTRSALATDASILDSPVYTTAQSAFLPNSQTLAYIDITTLAERLGKLAQLVNDPQLDLGLQLLAGFESASITAVYDETGSGAVRLVLTTTE